MREADDPGAPSRRQVVAVAGVRADVEGMPYPERRRAAPRPTERYGPGPAPSALRVVPLSGGPVLDAQTRLRLGHQPRHVRVEELPPRGSTSEMVASSSLFSYLCIQAN